ncbi:MAG: hypothetical protein ACLUAR_05275 [Pilosibacter sp.]
MEELAATINEISNNVEKNAENAKAASDMADNVSEQAGESRQRMAGDAFCHDGHQQQLQ